jgi:hypothetical protein
MLYNRWYTFAPANAVEEGEKQELEYRFWMSIHSKPLRTSLRQSNSTGCHLRLAEPWHSAIAERALRLIISFDTEAGL